MMDTAIAYTQKADIFLVVGTSLLVYPAAGLIDFAPFHIPKYVIDPNKPSISHYENLHFIEEKASSGLTILKEKLTASFG